MSLIEKTKDYIQSNDLLHHGDTVIVGVSGGADSVSLLHILYSLRYDLGLQLHVAHYNHNLRRGANADTHFVAALTQKLNLPYSTQTWTHPQLRAKGSLEEIARKRRLHFFTTLAKKINAPAIALAHTQDDLAETVVMRILRGCGLQGIRAILPKREIEGHKIIRPLLGVKKKEIISYLKKNHIAFRVDPTNQQKKFFRNQIRLDLLPLIKKKYNPNIEETLSHLAQNAATDYDYLEKEAKQFLLSPKQWIKSTHQIKIDRPSFSRRHPAIQRMLIRLAIEQLKGDTNRLTLEHAKAIENLLAHQPAQTIIHLPNEILAHKTNHHLILSRS